LLDGNGAVSWPYRNFDTETAGIDARYPETALSLVAALVAEFQGKNKQQNRIRQTAANVNP
jgi:hypothetical protein